MSVAVKLGNRSQLIIPKKIRDRLGLGPGKEVLLKTVGNSIVVKPRPENYTGSQRSMLSYLLICPILKQGRLEILQ